MPKEDEEYELMPHQTIAKIKHELDILKKKAGSMKEISSDDFKKSIDNLTIKIDSLMKLFKSAAEEMKEEEKKPGVEDQLKPLAERIDEIEDENKKIANGILVVADMIKELKKPKKMPKRTVPKPVFRQAPPPRPKFPSKPAPSKKPEQEPKKPYSPYSPKGAPKPGPKPTSLPPHPPASSGKPSIPPPRMPPPPSHMGAPAHGRPQAPKLSSPNLMPPPRPGGPSPMPPLPEEKKKEGFFSKIFGKKK